MKIEMDEGKNGTICLKLTAETPDEGRMLHVIDGAEVNTANLSGDVIAYLLSKPMLLKREDPLPSHPSLQVR